ncbi:cycle-inhibiting factor, partial [uncultured Vibrio sp.]|uniref:cycle-inhibiting factor n=1 Tax=uncultured Vibrio sp. TaxID=114054 RepID=UPI002621BEF1
MNHKFDERAFLDLCIKSSTNLRLNVVFNYDGEGGDPIRKINIDAIFEKRIEHIKKTAIEWKCSQDKVIKALEAEPYGIHEPVCGISAQNIIRIFLDTDVIGRVKVDTPFLGVDEFFSKIESRDPSKGYVSMIRDNNMGHAYVVHIPPQEGNVRVNIYQSDLGDGVMMSLPLSEWMEARG